jgi:osmoprotectant transport system substrate-binding protein
MPGTTSATRPEKIYGLHFESFLPLDTGGPLSADAIQRGTVDAGMLFTTDGTLAGDDLALLRDDRHLQPAESVTPIVRADTLERLAAASALPSTPYPNSSPRRISVR